MFIQYKQKSKKIEIYINYHIRCNSSLYLKVGKDLRAISRKNL